MTSETTGMALTGLVTTGRRKNRDQLKMRIRDPQTIIAFDVWTAKGNFKTQEDALRQLLYNSGMKLTERLY